MSNTALDSFADADPQESAQRLAAEPFDVVVIGAGQAGLAAGYHLKKRGMRFVIVDGQTRVGDSWRNRWDSLRLFTPARFDGLPGLRFPAPRNAFPTKDELADYLESYATRFDLPVRMGTRVLSVTHDGARYRVQTPSATFLARHVIVAMASYQEPRTPNFARGLAGRILQLHSAAYRNPEQLHPGPVLVVGAGNSGAEIALELAKDRRRTVYLAGRDTGHVPFAIGGLAARMFLGWVVLRFVFHYVLTVRTPMGRRARENARGKGAILVRTRPSDLERAGVNRIARIEGVRDGMPMLPGGELLSIANVVWATGYSPGFSWLERPVFDDNGAPLHDAGVARDEAGLYFLGLEFLYSMSSSMLHGVGRDAERIVSVIAERRARRSE